MEDLFQEEDYVEEELAADNSRDSKYVLAHAYVPWQYYKRAYKPAEALCKGTLFPELFGVYPIPK